MTIRIRSSASLSDFMEKQLDGLKAKMEKSSLALADYEKDIEVINPDQKTDILSSRLLQLNTEYTTAQADRVRNEAAWNAIQAGSIEAAEVTTQGDSLSKLSDALSQARSHLAEVKTTYGIRHPEYRKASTELAEAQKQFDDARRNVSGRVEAAYKQSLEREKMLERTVADTKAEWDQLNTKSFQYSRLKQEAAADKALYDELITKIHEANINAGFQDNNIRIADVARPSMGPVFPNTTQNLEIMLLVFNSARGRLGSLARFARHHFARPRESQPLPWSRRHWNAAGRSHRLSHQGREAKPGLTSGKGSAQLEKPLSPHLRL